MPEIKTKYINGQKVIRTVKSDGLTDSFGEQDMVFQCGFNTGSTPRWGKFDFKVNQTRVLIRVVWGENSYKMYEFLNVSSATISFMPGIDGNGGTVGMKFTNFQVIIYLSEPHLITNFETSTNSDNNRIGWGTYYINTNRCPNITKIKATNVDSTTISGISQLPLFYLEMISNNPSSITTAFSSMSNLKYLILNVWSGDLTIFHPNLRFFNGRIQNFPTFDLASFFCNTNRMGLILGGVYKPSNHIKYDGGAIFPEHIVEEKGMPITYILLLNNTDFLITKPTPDMVSRFLVDFANQVKSVTLANKRIAFGGLPPNTAYEDLTQPLYKNYTDAMAYITGTLGITVTF